MAGERSPSEALGVADRVMVLSLGRQAAVMDAVDVTTEDLKEAYRI